jgi:arylsulfatase A-like enzyme
MALAYGPNDPAGAGVNRAALRKQLACQTAVGKAVARFLGVKLTNLVAGRTRALAESRARTLLDRLPRSCTVPVVGDAGGVVLPAVGTTCTGTVGAPGHPVDPDALRACLVTGLEIGIDRVSPAPPPKPNLIVILTDDQRWDTTDLTHSRDGSTPVMPNVEAELAGSGAKFSNAVVTTALCCPSRSSILKGEYAHTTGVRSNTQPIGGALNFDDSSSLATWLHDAGYRTGLFGKYLNGYNSLWNPPARPYVPPGWDEWHAFRAPRYYDFRLIENGVGFDHASNLYPSGCATYTNCPGDQGGCASPTNYATDVLFQKVLAFLDQSAAQPFFLYIAPYAPHGPACPAKEDEGTFGSIAAWRPPNWNEADVSDKPAWVQSLCPMPAGKQASIDNFRKMQLESLQAVDRGVGALMAKLRQLGRDQSTFIIFTGDNGYSWGAHCHGPKRCPYDECMRVPLVVRYPPLVPAPRVETRIGLNIDFAFTLAELAGLVPPVQQDGRSMVGLLTDAEPAWRADHLYEQWLDVDDEDNDVVPPTLAQVRSKDWKYTEYVTGETELYNLVQDPFELDNQTSNPAHAQLKAELATRLRQLRPDWPPAGPAAAP